MGTSPGSRRLTGERATVREILQAAAIAGFGLLAALAVGAVATAGTELLVPGSLDVGSAGDALRHAVGFGLASLLVDVVSADVIGGVAPLTGVLAAFMAIASSIRARRWPLGGPRLVVAVVTATCGGLCALAAAVTRDAGVGASPVVAAANGLMLGFAASAAGKGAAERDARGPSDTAPSAAAIARGRSLRALVGAATILGATWLLLVGLAALGVGAIGPRALAGAVLAVLAFAPNVVAALVTLGCGGRVELAFTADGSSRVVVEGASLWDWNGAVAPWYVLALVLTPLVATIAAAAAAPGDPPLRRGLRNGLMLGTALFVIGSVGSYEAAAGAGGATLRLGVDPVAAAVLGLVWGVAGSLATAWIPRGARRPRLDPR